jgi:hypothetical protein
MPSLRSGAPNENPGSSFSTTNAERAPGGCLGRTGSAVVEAGPLP